MAVTPDNILINVATFNKALLARLQNQNCFIGTSNSRFRNFQDIPGQLGQTVQYDRTPRFQGSQGLVAQWEAADQQSLLLTVDKSWNVSYQMTDNEVVFNDVKGYMERWGGSAADQIGAQVEKDVASICETTPYRFYGDGTTAINTYVQLAQAVGQQKAFGSVSNLKGYLPIDVQISVSNSGQNQFVAQRNERLANSWEVGSFSNTDWYTSNLLPIHTSGVAGESGRTLQVVSTTTDASGAVTSITFQSTTSAISIADFVKQYDRFQFQDGVGSLPNVRFLTFVGYHPTNLPVQFLATADADSDGSSNVTVTINPPLQVLKAKDQNISTAIVAGMQAKVMPSHRVGMITTANPLFLAMPALPSTAPYANARITDSDTGVGMRSYHGFIFGMASSGMVHDTIWGKSLDPHYAMALLFPLS